MNVASFAVALRPRTMFEAVDLGVRLVQHDMRSVWGSWWPIALAVMSVAAASVQLWIWAPVLILAVFRAWLDRSLLFALSRSALGLRTRFSDVWLAWRHVWFGNLFLTFFWRPLSPWRSFTQPVYQLEGLYGAARRARKRQIARGYRGVAALVTMAMWLIETMFSFGLIALVFWFAPPNSSEGIFEWIFSGDVNEVVTLFVFGTQAAAFFLIEPFYVAAGFAMYVNRRVALEAWDIEQALRLTNPKGQ